MSKHHEIHLAGPAVQKDRFSSDVLNDLLAVMVEGAQGALKFRIEGRSSGRVVSWIREAARFDVITKKSGKVLGLEAPSLLEVAHRQFSQLDLFSEQLDKDATTLDLFEKGLQDALDGRADSESFDEGLVHTYMRFRSVFQDGIEKIDLINGRTLSFEPESLNVIDELRKKIPKPRQVRVAGVLNEIRHSDRKFQLLLESNETVRGVGADIDASLLSGLWGKHAVVTGRAFYRANGSLLRIEAETVQPARPQDLEVFQTVPKPLQATINAADFRVPQGRNTGINAIVGQWPGDESEEEIAEQLRHMS